MNKSHKYKKFNNRAFTLIELLAAIIIMGILVLIAIPAVTSYISDSKKTSYISTAKNLVAGARNFVNSGKFEMYDRDVTYYIDVSCIEVNNTTRSPYGEFDPAYVAVTFTGFGYNYYWTSRDVTGTGIKKVTNLNLLSEENIENDIEKEEIRTDLGVDGRGFTILISSNNNCALGEKTKAIGSIEGNGDDNPPICIRAKELHTKTCDYNSTTDGCGAKIGYGNTITYGNLSKELTLTPGDAFDCDVNDDGTYNPINERFYYVSSAYNSETNTFDNDIASLIYYTNVSNGVETTSQNYAFATQGDINKLGYSVTSPDNWHGPATAYLQLPDATVWKNQRLIHPGVRVIRNEFGGKTTNNGSKTTNDFDYQGKAARLITYQEIQKACGALDYSTTGALDDCNWLLENVIKYEKNISSGVQGYWLETPKSDNNNNFHVGSFMRNIGNMGPGGTGSRGVRPLIQVPKSSLSLDGKVKTLEVQFDADGGKFTNGESINTVNYQLKSRTVVSGNYLIPTKEGMHFAGWKSPLSDELYNDDKFVLSDGVTITYVKAVWIDDSRMICKRVTDKSKLHSETCNKTKDFCYATVGNGNTITYGNAKAMGNALAAGDAFDCDVNGDGTYDSNTERFYYVSEYFDTVNKTFDSDYGVFVYYSYYKSGIGPTTNGTAYSTENRNYEGPTNILNDLPTTVEWHNVNLINEERQILAENKTNHNSTVAQGRNLPLFSYTNKAARLLTAQELMRACGISTIQDGVKGEVDSCTFILEGSNYANDSYTTYGPWLESARYDSGSSIYRVNSEDRTVKGSNASMNNKGAKPVIEIPLVNVSY